MTDESPLIIRCLPRSLCSWNFDLSGQSHRGSIDLEWVGEQGTITADETRFRVAKHGLMSGRWSLNHDDAEVVTAQKQSVFTRSFEIDAPDGELFLHAESALTRSFVLERAGATIATIRPDHPFTRRAKIEVLTPEWDSPTIFFSFWLVVLMWRRAAQSSNGG